MTHTDAPIDQPTTASDETSIPPVSTVPADIEQPHPTETATGTGRHITLTTPISREDIEDIRVGDVIFLDGHITTCRDVAHRRLIEYGRELPVDVRDGAILHAGPIIRVVDEENDTFEVVSVGPTTSMRMEKFEEEFIEKTGVRLIVGKGGMGSARRRAARSTAPCTACSRRQRRDRRHRGGGGRGRRVA